MEQVKNTETLIYIDMAYVDTTRTKECQQRVRQGQQRVIEQLAQESTDCFCKQRSRLSMHANPKKTHSGIIQPDVRSLRPCGADPLAAAWALCC